MNIMWLVSFGLGSLIVFGSQQISKQVAFAATITKTNSKKFIKKLWLAEITKILSFIILASVGFNFSGIDKFGLLLGILLGQGLQIFYAGAKLLEQSKC